jgi:hypothetical protein
MQVSLRRAVAGSDDGQHRTQGTSPAQPGASVVTLCDHCSPVTTFYPPGKFRAAYETIVAGQASRIRRLWLMGY